MAREIKQYRPKKLIDGSTIGQEKGGQWVAIPDKFAGRQLEVIYGDASMIIKDWKKEALMFKRFRDKFWTADSNRKQFYTLGYFKFKPEKF